MEIKKISSPFSRVLSIILSILIVFYMVPITVFAKEADGDSLTSGEATESVDAPTEDEAELESPAIYEAVDLRDTNTKHFRLPDGSYVAAQYDYPIHYINDRGEFEDINNTLASSGSEFSTGDSRIKFIKKITGNGNIFTLHENNAKITMGLVGAEKKTPGVVTSKSNSDDYIEDVLGKMTNLENISSSIRYSDILDGVDIEYIVHSLNIKENIIVKERKDSYSYIFTLELNNLYAVLSSDGNVYITNANEEIKYVIPAPIVYDSNGEYAPDGESSYYLEEIGSGKYLLTVNVSSEWMNDEERAFPVTVDPPIEGVQGNLVDLYVDSRSPGSSFSYGDYLEVSATETAYIKFSESYFSSVPQGATIMMAALNIIGSSEVASGVRIGVYPVLSSWNNTLTYNKTLSPQNQGVVGSNAIDYEIMDVGDVRRSFDITELYEGWVNGESNFGIALKPLEENTEKTAYFLSYEYYTDDYDTDFYEPVLLVTYVYNDGLESYFPTTTHSAGIGGAGSINLATGRFTLAIPTLTATDNLFGFTPTLVYNSSLAGKPLTNANIISPFSTSYLPYGFKLNLQEFIQKKSYVDSEGLPQTYYALYDADGTTHTLYEIDGVIRDDSGLGLTLEIGTGVLTIKDKNHTVRTYTSYDPSNWYLTSITDKFGNQLLYKLDSQNRPTSVNVKPVGLGEITMLSFTYSGNMLSAVYNSTALEFVRLNYSGNYLSSIEYGIGDPTSSGATVYASASYTYDSGYITTIVDNTTGKSVNYTIESGKITKISEKAGDILGQEIVFDYRKNCTFVNSAGNDEILDTADDITTQYVLDRLGRAVAVNSYDVDGVMIYGSKVGVYAEFTAVAKNSLIETANIPVTGSYLPDGGGYFATVEGDIGNIGSYPYNFYDITKPSDAGISYSESDKFRISGLAKANSIIQNGYADFALYVSITYDNGAVILHRVGFADAEDVWQMASGTIDCNLDDGTEVTRKITMIDIICVYSGQLDTPEGEDPIAYFDKITFIESTDVDGARYTYDAKGNVAIMHNGTYTEYYEYNKRTNDLTRIANNRGEIYDYTYNADGVLTLERYYTFHRTSGDGNLLYIYPYGENTPDSKIIKSLVNSTKYSYNTYGLLTEVKSFEGDGTASGSTIAATYKYDTAAGSKIFGAMLTETDSRGYVTQYFYNTSNGNLLAEIDVSTGSGYVYTYDEIGRLEKVTPASGNASSYSGVANAEEVEYTYDSAHRLSSITTDSTVYTFTYDAFGNSTSVSAGNNTLATYEYNSNNGKLEKITYGNGFSEEYLYGSLEKATEVWYNYSNGTKIMAYSYAYNDDGSLKRFTNHQNGEVIVYTYDYAGRFVSSSETKSSNPGYKNDYSVDYNSDGRVVEAKNIIDYLASSTSYNATIRYTYDYNTDGTLQDERGYYGSGNVVISEYTYDELKRLTKNYSWSGSFSHTTEYTYYSDSNKTSNLVSSYKSTVNGTATTYNYTYDSKGNITKIVDSNGKTIQYYYDDLGQLTREINGVTGKTVIYSYDNAGNIKSKSVNESATYTYSSSQWGDLLTAYNGTAITYDNIGNPLSYYNGTSYTFTWDGRRLTSAVTSSKTMSFAYNDEGIRTSKTVNGVTTTYYVNGGQIVAESNNSRTIVYIYDASGSPIGMMYRKPSYDANTFDVFWYEKNLQGDVVAVYNSSGQKCITYKYDAWGSFTATASLTTGNNINALANPFRYRGYYYDTDLGMYYLQSRYYDAKICRFISADYASVTTATPYALTDKNLYAYCDNNPVMRIDKTGCIWNILIGAAVGMVVGVAISIVSQLLLEGSPPIDSGEFWANVGLAAAAGMISGGLAASGIPVAGQMIGNAIIGGLTGYFDVAIKDHFSGSKSTFATYALSTVDGALIGLIAGRIGGDGSASKHVSNSFWRRFFGKSNTRYYFTQINTQAVRDGKKAIPSILKGTLPSLVDFGIHCLCQ